MCSGSGSGLKWRLKLRNPGQANVVLTIIAGIRFGQTTFKVDLLVKDF